MTPENAKLIKSYGLMRQMHVHMNIISTDALRHAQQQTHPGPLVDAVYVLKKIASWAEAIRKDVNAQLEGIQMLGCVHAIRHQNSMKGDLARGSSNSTEQLIPPDREKDPKAHCAVMREFGVDSKTAMNPAIRVSFSALEERMSELASLGKPIPDGLKHLIQKKVFKMTCSPLVNLDQYAEAYVGPISPQTASSLESEFYQLFNNKGVSDEHQPPRNDIY